MCKTKDENGRINAETSREAQRLRRKGVKKQGRVPTRIRQKIMRWACDDWIEKHGKDYDIDWALEQGPLNVNVTDTSLAGLAC